MVLLTLIYLATAIYGVKGIASLANGLLKIEKPADRVKILCASQPKLCGGYFNDKKDRKWLFQSRISLKESTFDYNEDLYIPSKNKDVSCRFSKEAKDLIMRLTNTWPNRDYNRRRSVILSIKRLINGLVLLPNFNAICKYGNNNIIKDLKARGLRHGNYVNHALKDLESATAIKKNTKNMFYEMKRGRRKSAFEIPEI